ncbi:hypothetical protein RHMOL_Rhmol05G0113000 [Rhododendron molle]|uniref:Uncharacterized protein n=1 Tax=Rhododendron molle TaxID=49168 RepID=A0ACC0NPZ6_RHOML|nr:hypothetical protein RHMOL_Rhmol05G0113000 [Rhododendron molle]
MLGNENFYSPKFSILASEYMYCVQEQNKVVSMGILEKAKGICTTHGVNAETIAQLGDPKQAICDAVQKHNIDLLVLSDTKLGKIQSAVISDAYNSHKRRRKRMSYNSSWRRKLRRKRRRGRRRKRKLRGRRSCWRRREVQVLPIFNIPKTMLQVYGHSVYCVNAIENKIHEGFSSATGILTSCNDKNGIRMIWCHHIVPKFNVSFPCGCMQELFQGYYFCQEREDFFQQAKPYKDHLTILRMQKLAKELGVLIPFSFFEEANNAH